MKDYIEERVLELANYIIETNSTVRAAASKFRVSKSTVHKDVTERLLEINQALALEVKGLYNSQTITFVVNQYLNLTSLL